MSNDSKRNLSTFDTKMEVHCADTSLLRNGPQSECINWGKQHQSCHLSPLQNPQHSLCKDWKRIQTMLIPRFPKKNEKSAFYCETALKLQESQFWKQAFLGSGRIKGTFELESKTVQLRAEMYLPAVQWNVLQRLTVQKLDAHMKTKSSKKTQDTARTALGASNKCKLKECTRANNKLPKVS